MKDCTICNRQLCADPTTCRGELAALLARLDEPRQRGERERDFWGDGWTLSVDQYRNRVENVRQASIRQAEIRAGITDPFDGPCVRCRYATPSLPCDCECHAPAADDCDPHGIPRPSLMVVPS